jgi:endonuclease-8
VPEGDTILHAVRRMRPVLEGRVPEEILTPQPRHAMDRWGERLAGRAVRAIDAHGKHLFLHFEGELTLHSHLRMTGAWGVYERGAERWRRAARRAWLILRTPTHEVVEFDGPVLELLVDSRTRFDQRLAGLGPDVLADEFDSSRFVRRLRSGDPIRGIGDALLDQRVLAGVGNLWKAEACWEAGVDPWRAVSAVEDEEALAIVDAARPGMLASALGRGFLERPRVYGRAGRPCPRCGQAICSRGQGDDNRTTYWCPGCQS